MRPAFPLLYTATLSLFALGLGPSAAAQTASEGSDLESAATARSLRSVFGVDTDGERQFGGGETYKVELTERGFEFVPAFGRAVETNRFLELELQSIEREGTPVLAQATAQRPELQRGDALQRAVWSRAGGVEERLEFSEAGVELSYLFPTRPAGSGDLVVRTRLETNLTAPAGHGPAGELRFDEPGVGAVSIGQVFGVDATGRRIEGHTRLDGETLELVLPAEFVDLAAYPLLLDPFIGTTDIVASGYDEGDPDVAYDESTDEFLVVWERGFSFSDFDIRGTRLNGSGNVIPGLIFVENGPNIAFNPAIGNIDPNSAFLVAWQEGTNSSGPYDIRARAMDAGSSSGSTAVTLNTASVSAFGCDVSDSTTDNRNLVAWTQSNGGIKGRIARTDNSLGISFPTGVLNISDDPEDNVVAISKSGGTTAIWAVVWQRRILTTTPSNSQIAARMVRFNGDMVTSISTAGFSNRDEELPDVDGEGGRYMVTYRRDESSSSSSGDIVTRPLTWDGGDTHSWGSWVEAHGDSNDDETRPRIAYTGDAYVVVWQDAFSNPPSEVRRVVVDPFQGQPCGNDGTIPSAPGGGAEYMPTIASKYRALDYDSQDTLMVFENEAAGATNATIQAALYRADFGLYNDLGGDCSAGGRYSAACCVAGETSKHRLEGAAPGAGAFLIGSAPAVPFPCGSCVLHANPAGLLIAAGPVDFLGNKQIDLAVPAGFEGNVYNFQWAVQDPSPNCPVFFIDLSNSVQITIE